MAPELGGELIGAGYRGLRAAVSTVGDLEPEIANTFRLGRYTKTVLQEPMQLTRYFDNVNAGPLGRFLTNSTSGFSLFDRIGLAVRPSWNAMTDIATWEAPAGTTVYSGRAAMQFPWLGGKMQYFINFEELPNLIRIK